MTDELQILKDMARSRREALILRVLHTLRDTIELVPLEADAREEEMRVEWTDASARVIAPLVEAVGLLEAIIFASDGCVGHRNCAHSMEAWEQARALLQGKWSAEAERRQWP